MSGVTVSNGGSVVTIAKTKPITLSRSGANGASAYQLWLAAGNTGTLQDYLASVGLPANHTQAMSAAESPSALNPFVTESASEAAITELRVDYDSLVAATISI